jgi:ferredoxin
MSKMSYLPNVATLRLNRETCIGCGTCLTVCPHGVLELADKKARIAVLDACMECGACATNCPVAAITVESGVGCAQAVIKTLLRGRPAADSCC